MLMTMDSLVVQKQMHPQSGKHAVTSSKVTFTLGKGANIFINFGSQRYIKMSFILYHHSFNCFFFYLVVVTVYYIKLPNILL